PYLGWGPENRQGYFKCSTVGRYQADDLWDTAAVLRLLLKYSEIEPNPTRSPYLKRAQSIIDRWKYVDRSLDDGAYARAGMRWYMKSNDPCEIRYVKNTNLVMAEQLLRIYRITKQANYLRSAVLAINAELWDVLTRRNLAYSSFMIYEDRSEPVYTEMTAQNESKIVHTAQSRPDDTLMCNGHDSSCWNHLGFEGYDLYLIEQLIAEIDENKFPVPGTKRDISKAREQIMGVYRSSSFGNTERFPWDSKESNTHITAYNCALRFSSPVYEHECLDSLQHHNASGTVFYALVPDAIFTRSTR
ncbi:MAG TPA: hypothetical protein VEZ90_09960, partial [Blastocatellia bacterium]|nr:hypothetical protein [Blastocatellia bacterium]